MNTTCPPVQPCYCPQADTPVAGTLLPQGGPGAVIQVPIYGTQGFSVSLTSNPTLPISQVPLISSVTIQNGNILTITTASPAINETLGPYVATVHVCNACGELDIQVQVDVVADIQPVLTSCLLAQQLWTPEARVPTAGDTLLAFTPAGCRSLLPPVSACVEIAAFPAGPAPSGATRLVTNACQTVTVAQVIDLVDVCAELNTFPLVVPALTDMMVLIKAGVCGRATLDEIGDVVLDDVDLCQLFQDLPNAVVQPTATFFGEQGGLCFQFAVGDLGAAIAPGLFPLLAPSGSCLAPSYSFTASPDSGMFYTGTAVRIGDDNCTDFIEVGASINLNSTGTITHTAGGQVFVNAQDLIANCANSIVLTSNFGPVQLVSTLSTALVQSNGGAATLEAINAIARVITTGSGIVQLTGAGGVQINAAVGQNIDFRINGTTNVLRFTAAGAWEIPSGSPGIAGQVITSGGPGVPPTWQTPSGGSVINLYDEDSTGFVVPQALQALTFALGSNATVLAGCANSFAIGNNAQVQGATSRAIAIGFSANASGVTAAIAIGDAALSQRVASIAIGDGATSGISGFNNIAIGSAANADFSGIAIGGGASTLGGAGFNKIAIGEGALSSGSGQSIAIGQGANASGTGSPVAIGPSTAASGSNSTVVGPLAQGTAAEAVAIGESAVAQGTQSVAIGSDPNALASGSIAIGDNSSAQQLDSMAIGRASSAQAAQAVAIGFTAQALGADSIAIGENTFARSAQSVVIGSDAQTAAAATATVTIGENASTNNATASNSIAIGNAATSSADECVGIGRQCLAGGTFCIAIGTQADARTTGAIAIGVNSTVSSGLAGGIAIGNAADGRRGIAIGASASSFNGGVGTNVAIGPNVVVNATDSVHIGTSNTNKFVYSSTGVMSLTGTGAMYLLPSYTVAGLPTAANNGGFIYVTNESGGAVPAFSDGVNWRRVTDRAIVT